MQIPFLDLSRQNFYSKEIQRDLSLIVEKQSFIIGEYLNKFENEFAKYNNIKCAIGVANGSEAIEIILRALEIPQKSEVLLPANTFIATAQSVIRSGHVPVLVDVNHETLLSEAENYVEKINAKTKVILPVHLYGQIPNMRKIKALAEAYNLFVVEDAAQSQGSMLDSNKMGFYSDAAATSFYPGKNLGAWGDGGAIVTNSIELLEKMKMIRNYGSKIKYEHDFFGINSRLDEIQAAVLLHKLDFLDKWNSERNDIAQIYDEFFAKTTKSFEVLPTRAGYFNNYHLYVVRTTTRDRFQNFLESRQIQTIIHYPIPIYAHKGLEGFFDKPHTQEFNVTEKASKQILSLPIFPGMTTSQIDYILESLASYDVS